ACDPLIQAERRCKSTLCESKQVGFFPLPRVGGALLHAVVSIRNLFGTVKPPDAGPQRKNKLQNGPAVVIVNTSFAGIRSSLVICSKNLHAARLNALEIAWNCGHDHLAAFAIRVF